MSRFLRFTVYLGIYGPHNIMRNTAICYVVDDTSLRKNARPVMHWLLANACVYSFDSRLGFAGWHSWHFLLNLEVNFQASG